MLATKGWVEKELKKERRRTEDELTSCRWKQDLWAVNAEKRLRILYEYLNLEFPYDFDLNTALPKARIKE